MSASSPAAALTSLILEVLRAETALAAAGDDLVADLSLTGARWKVLGAVRLAPSPSTVPEIAARMGLSRQGVQRLVNAMAEEGLIELRPNPRHARSPRVAATAAGAAAFAEADSRRRAWAEGLAQGLDPADLAAATAVLSQLRRQLANSASN